MAFINIKIIFSKNPKFSQNIAAMDEEFYQDLYRKQKSGELSEEEMGALIEEHLDRVEEFKRKVQSEMKQRRKARTKVCVI